MEVPQGACATQINFLVDISRLLEKNMTRVASSMKESMSSISDLLETLLVFMGADSRDASAAGSMESILLQLLDSIKHIQDYLKLFSSQSCRLKDNLNSGADVEADITKHFTERLNAIAPNFKKYVSVQHSFFQSVDYELNAVYQELSDRSNGTSSGKKRPPVPAPRPRTAQPRVQKAEIAGKGGVCFETDYPLAPRTKRSGSVEGPNSSPSRNSPPPVPRRGAAHSHDDLSRPFVDFSPDDHQRGKTVGGSSSIPVPSVPRPQGEAPPPSRPSSTQVDFVPAQNLSATQTLLATVSVLGGTGNAPVLVNHYHSKPAPTQTTPPPSTTTPVSIHTSSPIPTRKPSPALPPVSPSGAGGRGAGGLTVRPTHFRSASSDDSGITLGGSGQINTHQKNVTNPNNRATYSPRRVVPPIFEGDSGEWVLQKRQAKGTTGVDPALVQGRREYWKGNQEKVVSSLQPSYQL